MAERENMNERKKQSDKRQEKVSGEKKKWNCEKKTRGRRRKWRWRKSKTHYNGISPPSLGRKMKFSLKFTPWKRQ